MGLRHSGAPMDTSMTSKKGPVDYRSAKDGKFVTEQYAKTHKTTTEGEHNRKPPSPPKKSK
jgi:hypothetical protein